MNRHNLRLEKYGLSPDVVTELRGFCWQYKEKKQKINSMVGLSAVSITGLPSGGGISDTTERQAERREKYINDVELIESSAMAACNDSKPMYDCLMRNITEKKAFNFIPAPCSKNTFTLCRHKFFYILAKKKGLI